MQVVLTRAEFEELRKAISNTRNREIINGFNRIFQPNNDIPVKGVVLPKTGNIVIEMTPEDGTALLRVLSANAETFGEMVKNDVSLTAIPKWLSFGKNIVGAIVRLFRR